MFRKVLYLAFLAAYLTCLYILTPQLQASEEPRRDEGVLNLSNSPHAKLKNIPVRAVKVEDGFWGARRKVNVEKSIPGIRVLLEEHGLIDNFRRITKGKPVERKGPVFTDSDVYKWIEAVGYVLQSEDRRDLRAAAEEWIDEIVAIQEPSGYLNTYFVGDKVPQRLTPETMDWGHELYCLGHMLQAAIAYYRATGNSKLLDAGIRYVEFLLRDQGPDKRPLLAGHPEIEMSLVELYRTTGDRRYLELAHYILEGDKRINRPPQRVVYTFSGIPFTERTKLQGHAVRAMYASCGATDYYLETGDQQYWRTLENLSQDMVNGKMYVTGGLGARWEGESIGDSYELPNARAYAETCAAIGSYMWNWRMLAATGEARFTDVMERALYNAINVGMSLDGTLYCYVNPLESSGRSDPNRHSMEGRVRNPWYEVLCCPPNIQRTLGSLPGYFYSTSQDGLYVHLYDNSLLDWHLEDGTGLKLAQKTNYPWEGTVQLTLTPAKRTEFTFYVRIPGWSPSAKVLVNGKTVKGEVNPGTYLPIRRRWQAGDKVRLELNMTPRLVAAHPRVLENIGRVAVQRGPLVYCIEQTDQPDVESLFDVSLAVGKDPAAGFRSEFRPDMLGGIVVLRHPAVAYRGPRAEEPLYRPIGYRPERQARDVELTLIPYYAWANRNPSPMQVWIPLAEKK